MTESMIPYNLPNCCKHCSNHLINGGNGVCCCTLPAIQENTTSYNQLYIQKEIAYNKLTKPITPFTITS